MYFLRIYSPFIPKKRRSGSNHWNTITYKTHPAPSLKEGNIYHETSYQGVSLMLMLSGTRKGCPYKQFLTSYFLLLTFYFNPLIGAISRSANKRLTFSALLLRMNSGPSARDAPTRTGHAQSLQLNYLYLLTT